MLLLTGYTVHSLSWTTMALMNRREREGGIKRDVTGNSYSNNLVSMSSRIHVVICQSSFVSV